MAQSKPIDTSSQRTQDTPQPDPLKIRILEQVVITVLAGVPVEVHSHALNVWEESELLDAVMILGMVSGLWPSPFEPSIRIYWVMVL